MKREYESCTIFPHNGREYYTFEADFPKFDVRTGHVKMVHTNDRGLHKEIIHIFRHRGVYYVLKPKEDTGGFDFLPVNEYNGIYTLEQLNNKYADSRLSTHMVANRHEYFFALEGNEFHFFVKIDMKFTELGVLEYDNENHEIINFKVGSFGYDKNYKFAYNDSYR